jgi:hypothetical protein
VSDDLAKRIAALEDKSTAKEWTPSQRFGARLMLIIIIPAIVFVTGILILWAVHYPVAPTDSASAIQIANYHDLVNADNSMVEEMLKSAGGFLAPALTFIAGSVFSNGSGHKD